MSHCIDDSYDVYDEKKVRARVAHKCHACKEVIAPGYYYWRIGRLFDHEWSSILRCPRCQKIHKHLRNLDIYGDSWPDEQLDCGEEYKDHWGKSPPPEIAALAFALQGEVD